ncbi:MAG: VOC family protein [Cyclobacteriaceae bacterium]|nr:VOC family protein [Cyclobacteriaceae bacterium]
MKYPIYPCLWFDGKAAEAAAFYCSVFSNSRIISNSPMVTQFELTGKKFMGLNGGPQFKFTQSVSMFVFCETPKELDTLWAKLAPGGTVMMPLDKYPFAEKFGWTTDRFGLSWQLFLSGAKQEIKPCLLFVGDQFGRAEEAITFYTSVFKDSQITDLNRYEKGQPAEGSISHARFTLGGTGFVATESNLSHDFNFNESISFVVECETQDEIDYYWNKLTEGGQESMCGWLKDKFGVSWQIVPAVLGKLMSDPQKSQRVMQAFLKMKKFEIEKLLQA